MDTLFSLHSCLGVGVIAPPKPKPKPFSLHIFSHTKTRNGLWEITLLDLGKASDLDLDKPFED